MACRGRVCRRYRYGTCMEAPDYYVGIEHGAGGIVFSRRKTEWRWRTGRTENFVGSWLPGRLRAGRETDAGAGNGKRKGDVRRQRTARGPVPAGMRSIAVFFGSRGVPARAEPFLEVGVPNEGGHAAAGGGG